MKKDPTEFRQRFAAWKNGELVYKDGLPTYRKGKNPIIYKDNDIPFIQDKAVKLTNAGLATGAILSTNMLDSIADAATRQGLDINTAIGLATKESTLGNPTDDTSVYHLLSPEKAAVFKKLGTGLYINKYGDAVKSRLLVNYYKDLMDAGIGDDEGPVPTTNESVLDAAFRLYANSPQKYNPGQKNYQQLVDKRAKEVSGSPEVKRWRNAYDTKRAVRQWTKPNLLLKESRFNKPAYKDGKLPGYEDGDKPITVGEYNVYPSAVGASELNVTTPEVVVTGKDRRPLYLRYAAERSTYDPELITNFTGLIPGIGDVLDATMAVDAYNKGDYLSAGVLGAGLVLPNILQKPLAWMGKKTLPLLTRWHGKFSDDASDIALTGIGAVGGGTAGYLNSDENEKYRDTVFGTIFGSSVGVGRGLARSIIRDPKTKIIVPLKYRELTDAILDPFEYLAANHYGYYKKNPDIVGFAKNDAIRRGLPQNAADGYGKHVDLTTQFLNDPSYVIKHGYNSNGITHFDAGNATIDIKETRRNSNLPPRDQMGFKNPLLGIFAHENNHAFNFENTTGSFLLSMPDGTYYSPNDYYYDKNIVSKLKALSNNKQSSWQKSPEEIESEIHNYLAQNNTTYLNLSMPLKKELRDLLSYRFNISKKNLGTLFDVMEHIGARSENMHHLLPNAYPFFF